MANNKVWHALIPSLFLALLYIYENELALLLLHNNNNNNNNNDDDIKILCERRNCFSLLDAITTTTTTTNNNNTSPAAMPAVVVVMQEEEARTKPRSSSSSSSSSVLFAIKSPATQEAMARRNLIRRTFVRQVMRDYPRSHMNYTFYLSSPYTHANILHVWHEMAQYEDITLLRGLNETHETATTRKTLEFLKLLVVEGERRKHYDWICHVDDDSYVQVYRLMNNYLWNPKILPFRTIIGRKREQTRGGGFVYPGGQMYCMSWDLVRLFATRFDEVMLPSIIAQWPAVDDVWVGLFFHTIGWKLRFIELPNEIAYDLGNSVDMQEYSHVANPTQGVNPHKLKTEKQYLATVKAYEQTYFRRPAGGGDATTNHHNNDERRRRRSLAPAE